MSAHSAAATAGPRRAVRSGVLHRRSLQSAIARVVYYVLAVALGLMFVSPFLFALSTSLMNPSELFHYPIQWLPKRALWSNYVTAWTMAPFTRFLINTSIVTALAMLGQLATASLVAYGFARFRFPGRNTLFIVLLGMMLIPVEVTIIPTFLMMKFLGWTNSWLPLIVPSYFGGGSFTIFLLRQFFLTLPRDLDEAAKIDGASTFRILVQILLPLMRPALATAAIFAFVHHWNDFFFPLVYIDSTDLFTLSIGLRYFQKMPAEGGAVTYHLLMAASLLVTIPVIAVFFAAQRYFIQGIVMSGIKG